MDLLSKVPSASVVAHTRPTASKRLRGHEQALLLEVDNWETWQSSTSNSVKASLGRPQKSEERALGAALAKALGGNEVPEQMSAKCR